MLQFNTVIFRHQASEGRSHWSIIEMGRPHWSIIEMINSSSSCSIRLNFGPATLPCLR